MAARKRGTIWTIGPLLLLLATICESLDPLYTIAAPNSLRPESTYEVVVTIHQASSPVLVKATLAADLNFENVSKQALVREETIKPGETKTLHFPIGQWSDPVYTLTIVGSGGITFTKTVSVGFNGKIFSVFIQTDKAIYQPGHLVQFRVIATESSLKPYQTNDANIYIIDAQGNRIKQWTNITLKQGVFSGQLQLADQVIFGEWYIKARIKNVDQTKQFTVAEYVLPTFEVNVQLPSLVTFNESDVVATVTAKYTYGKPVKGQVSLNVSDYYCKWPCMGGAFQPFVIKSSIDGKAELKMNMVKDMSLPDYFRYSNRRFEFTAVVTEDLTSRQQNSSSDFTLYQNKYSLDFAPAGTFKPGLLYSVMLNVKHQDDSPVIDDDGKVVVTYSYSWRDESKNTLEFPVPKNGVIDVSLVPPESAEMIRFEATYKDVKAYNSIQKAQSLSERYMQITLLSQNPKVGDQVELDINSTRNLEDPLILQVVGRGNILKVEQILGSKATKQLIKLKLTPEMAPKVRIIVFYATACGEVVADSVDFGIDGIFKNRVTVAVKPDSTKPGSDVEVIVSANPSSHIGVLAVDQSVLLLKSGNDITNEMVLNDLQDYEIGVRSYYPFAGGRFRRMILPPWRPTASSTMELFSNVGLLFITNGLLYKYPQYGGYGGYGGGGGVMMRPGFGMAQAFNSEMAGPPGSPGRPPPPPPSTRFGSDTNLMEPVRVRKIFPETFLWVDTNAGEDGTASIKASAPDTITSYVISAFAIDDHQGLGIAESPTKLQIFRPFFVVLNLPYSVVRGETIALQVLVFNYLDTSVDAQVTLDNVEGNFGFPSMENEVDEQSPSANQKEMVKTVKVNAGEGASVFFMVKPKTLGYVDFKVTAKSTAAADALIKKLLVKAEGIPTYFNKAVLIDLRKQPNFESKIDISIPNDVVPESERIEVSAISDVMGTTVNNLDKLLRMPYGCGEQNMLNFVPNIVVTEYLANTDQLTQEIKSKAVKFMESGYQRELTYKRVDDSFSAFGNSDKNGSTWLTAFVIKSFWQASPYITIDEGVMSASLTWLAKQQDENGSFSEHGEVFHKAMQGGSGSGLALTAYVLSVFLQNENKSPGVEAVISRSKQLLEKELDNVESDYELVIVTYALHLAGSNLKDSAFNKMDQRAKVQGDLKFWSVPVPEVNQSDYMAVYNRPRPVDVEMTSYALLTFAMRDQLEDAVPLMRWLISKRNEFGGFESTQDTVLGIQALAKFAEKLSGPKDSQLDITIEYETDKKTMKITRDTALILHREQLPRTVRQVEISAAGNGVGIVQVTWSYNVVGNTQSPAFDVTSTATGEKDELHVESCATYQYDHDGGESNMAVMEIGFPSGYSVDKDSLPVINKEKMIKRVETKDGDSVVVIYFDKIGKEVCTAVNGFRAFKVAEMKPAIISVYDYYDPAKSGSSSYSAPSTSMCDICQGSDCNSKCH